MTDRVFIVGPNASGKSNLLDALRFLKDIAKLGGGLQQAIVQRGGVSKIRCLAARKEPAVEIDVELKNGSRSRTLRESIVPRQGSTAVQGPDYNGCLGDFVRNHWDRDAAARRSPSLGRAWERLRVFEPSWASS